MWTNEVNKGKLDEVIANKGYAIISVAIPSERSLPMEQFPVLIATIGLYLKNRPDIIMFCNTSKSELLVHEDIYKAQLADAITAIRQLAEDDKGQYDIQDTTEIMTSMDIVYEVFDPGHQRREVIKRDLLGDLVEYYKSDITPLIFFRRVGVASSSLKNYY